MPMADRVVCLCWIKKLGNGIKVNRCDDATGSLTLKNADLPEPMQILRNGPWNDHNKRAALADGVTLPLMGCELELDRRLRGSA
jgi:hypothetical protein